MAKRSNPIKALKVKIINIVLYPEEAQKTENYIEYFKKIFEDKITVKLMVIDIQEFKLIIQQMMVMLFMEHLQMQLFLIQRPPL